MTNFPYNTRTSRVEGASFTASFFAAVKDGMAELVEGYEMSSSSSSSDSSSSVSSSSVSSVSSSSMSSESSISSQSHSSLSSIGTLYVSLTGNDANDGASPARAKLTIQAAVDAADTGYVINVAAGRYYLNSVITVAKQVSIIGASPSATIIDGQTILQCFRLSNGAAISDMTIQRGFIRATSRNGGGGVYMANSTSVTRCIIKNNTVTGDGGGSSQEGGGGVFMTGGTLQDSLVINNSSTYYTSGGGVFIYTRLTQTSAYIFGCAICDNVVSGSGASCGGVYSSSIAFQGVSTMANCIVTYNTAPNVSATGGSLTQVTNVTTNTTPDFTNRRGGDYRLTPDAVAYLNVGTNSYADAYDLDKNPRIFGSTVDIGAYERQS